MFVINPKTNRKIKVGSKAYKKLIESGQIQHIEPVEETKVEPKKDDDETRRLIELSSLQATKLYKKIKSGKLEIPENVDDDASLSNYLQQSLMLSLMQEKDELIKSMKKKKKVKFESESESSDSE